MMEWLKTLYHDNLGTPVVPLSAVEARKILPSERKEQAEKKEQEEMMKCAQLGYSFNKFVLENLTPGGTTDLPSKFEECIPYLRRQGYEFRFHESFDARYHWWRITLPEK
jgi:hypothetical protein